MHCEVCIHCGAERDPLLTRSYAVTYTMTPRLRVPVFLRADMCAICLSVCLYVCCVSPPRIRIEAFTAGGEALSLVAWLNNVILVNEKRI